MIYLFGDLHLDDQRFELRRNGKAVPVEPQVFLVLRELLRAAGRLVTKDQFIDSVWQGRAVSDASIASRIRAARAAIGDDGERQQLIRTVHGQGFRMAIEVRQIGQVGSGDQQPGEEGPSVAILPFRSHGLPPDQYVLTEALAHEVLRALSRMRWLLVIARGSSFRFDHPAPDLGEIGATLGARYILTGVLELAGTQLTVRADLIEAATERLLWSDRLSRPLADLAELRQFLVTEICAALEVHIPLNEARLAEGKAFQRLDARANFHLGLRQMYRFTSEANAQASEFFARAVALDPGLARAHAGLSFTSFQTAFMRYGPDRDRAIHAARAHAERSMDLDPLDPFAAFTLGRSYWLTDEIDIAAGWLSRATDLNPNYAQGHYCRGILATLMAHPEQAETRIDRALRLSPLDPLLYGMYGTRALGLIQTRDFAAAADWADRAAAAPNAHYLIAMLATAANALAGREHQAGIWQAHLAKLRPDCGSEQFFTAFPLRDAYSRKQISDALKARGL